MPLSALAGKAAKRGGFAVESTARDDGIPARRVVRECVGSLDWGSHGFGTRSSRFGRAPQILARLVNGNLYKAKPESVQYRSKLQCECWREQRRFVSRWRGPGHVQHF